MAKKRKPKRQLTDNKVKIIEGMLRSGLGISQICVDLDLSYNTVNRVFVNSYLKRNHRQFKRQKPTKFCYWENEEEIEFSLNPTYEISELRGDDKKLLKYVLPKEWKID